MYKMHASFHYMPFKKKAAHSASSFLEAIRCNSALPRHSTVVVTRPSIAENCCTRGMRGLRLLRQCESHATAPAFLPTWLCRLCIDSVTSRSRDSIKLKMHVLFLRPHLQLGLINTINSIDSIKSIRPINSNHALYIVNRRYKGVILLDLFNFRLNQPGFIFIRDAN